MLLNWQLRKKIVKIIISLKNINKNKKYFKLKKWIFQLIPGGDIKLGFTWTLDVDREDESLDDCNVLWPFIVAVELEFLFDCTGGVVITGGARGLASIGFTGPVFDDKDGIMDFADGGKTYDEWILGKDGTPVFFPVFGRALLEQLEFERE